jgi:hypothetical protein
MLDGAPVLWWAWSGDQAFGQMPGAPERDRWIYGLAICRYESGSLYRFSCNKEWEVVNDAPASNEDEAKNAIPVNYDRSRVFWQRYSVR